MINNSKNSVRKFKPLPMVNFKFKLPFEQIESSSNGSAVTSLLSKNTFTPTQRTPHEYAPMSILFVHNYLPNT